MHDVEVKSILSAKNGMNLYRGCSHGCIYCDSRSNCYQINHDFEDIEVKVNAPALLEQALRRKRQKCMIGTGSMCDPYLHIEQERHLARRCLELIDEYGFGVSLLTKSDRILRDLDLLKKINRKSKCVVQMTMTTYDEALCKLIEPHVCTTARRAEVLNILRDEGIPTIVWMTPILPYINDTMENLNGLLKYCIDARVYGILTFGMGVTLREGDREYFYAQLDKKFPGMKQKYIKAYGNAYNVNSPHNKELMEELRKQCREHDMVCNPDVLFRYMAEYENKSDCEQMNLFDFL